VPNTVLASTALASTALASTVARRRTPAISR
jgi:hypothetical protein